MFISRLLVCKYRFTRILLGAYKALRGKKGMQYRSRCIFFSDLFENALLFRYIYKGRLVKISANTAFLFYKEIYMNYLILYYKFAYCIPSTCILIGAVRRGFGGSCSGCKNNNYDTMIHKTAQYMYGYERIYVHGDIFPTQPHPVPHFIKRDSRGL